MLIEALTTLHPEWEPRGLDLKHCDLAPEPQQKAAPFETCSPPRLGPSSASCRGSGARSTLTTSSSTLPGTRESRSRDGRLTSNA